MKAQVIWYQKAKVYDLEIFYRRSGPAAAPTILLLHGFPTSSHMYRNLIPLLNEKYHVIAPDLLPARRRRSIQTGSACCNRKIL
jgi:pimeloyl-ACP methyl ester carboxylesterase